MDHIPPASLFFLAALLLFPPCSAESSGIDRRALVQRHNPTIRTMDRLSPLSVGNGQLAFTVGITGLQTFTESYARGIPLCTLSYWGWHTVPNREGYRLEDAMKYYDTYGRPVGYASVTGTPAANWLRGNPHRLHLGRIGFILKREDGSEVVVEDVAHAAQTLDLWTGRVTSDFEIEGQPVHVETACHGSLDAIGVRVVSPLVESGRLAVRFAFPYGSQAWGLSAADWTHPDRHETAVVNRGKRYVLLKRVLDADTYYVRVAWTGDGHFVETAKHTFVLAPTGEGDFAFTCAFGKNPLSGALPTAAEVRASAAAHWRTYWTEGGVIDLSGSTDPRARELERRIVLSQYLVGINSAGGRPTPETGLTCNSWYGKPHLEMHWWHGVHFALWGHPGLLEESLPWYQSILPMARATAAFQGYKGARWPKMVGPDGREGPSGIAVFLIWQQPHPIYYAELLYRLHPDRETLEKYREIVFESAAFMASYAHWDEISGRYVLGPPLIPAQERFAPEKTVNPAFELAYWPYGLEIAQQWRERLGLPREAQWDRVLQHISPMPEKDGLYVNAESAPDTFGTAGPRKDHPAMLMAYGMIPGPKVDPGVMRATLKRVLKTWDWASTWGWDFPMIAMAAARVGEPALAIDALMMDVQKNTYLKNGHNYQHDGLPLYLPGNGALLTAVAMMAAGWDGAPSISAPGFPQDGTWTVRWEGLGRLP